MHGAGQPQHRGNVERQVLHADIGVKPRGLVLAGLGHGLLDLGKRSPDLGQHGPHHHRHRGRILLAKPLGMAKIELTLATGQGPQSGRQVGRQDLAPPQSQESLHGKCDGNDGNEPDGIKGPHVRAEPLDIAKNRSGLGFLDRRAIFFLRVSAAEVAGGLGGKLLRRQQCAAVGLGRWVRRFLFRPGRRFARRRFVR